VSSDGTSLKTGLRMFFSGTSDLTGFVAFLSGIFCECFFITIKGVFHI